MPMQANGKFHKSVDLSVTNFTDYFDELYITGAGNITIVDYNDVAITITLPANYWYKAGGKQITKATTTATGIVAYRYSTAF
jgi:hypothetical protein